MLMSFDFKTSSRVFINSVDEHLSFEQNPLIRTDVGYSNFAWVSMLRTKTDENAKDLSIEQRKCFFSDEIKLKYSNELYSFSGCMKECKIDQAMEVCGCLPPFYVAGNFTACDIESLKCLKDERIWDIRSCKHCELSCDFTAFSIDKLKKS